MALKVGDKAPEFSLYSSKKEVVNLTDYKGKNVVILFFPFAFSGVCTTELCSIRDNMNSYTSLNAEIIGISVDSVFTLDAFAKDQGYTFTLLSDFNKQVCRAYEAYYEDFPFDYHGVARRSAFVLDGSGTIRYAEVLESAGDLPNFDGVKSALEALNA